jgi:hypothetical protein
MRTLYPGHRYALANLKSDGEQVLQFRQDAPLHPEAEGTCCQEVIRALIDRVQVLDAEVRWHGNDQIIWHARQMLAGFEARAILRKAEKGASIETWRVAEDGHLLTQRDPKA